MPDAPTERELAGMSAATWRAAVGSPHLRSAMTAVFVLGSAPDPEVLANRMDRISRLFPALRSRIIAPPTPLARPRLVVDPDFDLSLHLAHYVMPGPGSWQQVLRYARRYSLTDLDRDRALWRAVLLDGLRGGRSAVVLVVHHAIADGQGLVKIAAGLLDDAPSAGPAAAMPEAPAPGRADRQSMALASLRDAATRGPRAAHGAARSAHTATRTLVTHPRRTAGGARRLAGSARRMAGSARRVGRVHAAPLSPLLSGRGATYTPLTLDVSFPGLRQVAKAYGGTLNDAFLAGLAAGIRRYHEALDAPPGSVRVNVPISFRTDLSRADDNTQAIARIELDAAERDPATRIAAIQQAMAGAIDESFLPHMDLAAEASRLLPIEAIVALSRGSDLTASNVPGVPVPVWLGGAAVERIYPVVATLGAAANITLLSYAGRWCSIGVAVDDLAIERPALFLTSLAEGFAELGVEPASEPYDPLDGRSRQA